MSIEVPIILTIIAIILFYTTYWVVKKYNQNLKKAKITALVLSIISTPLAYYGLILLLMSYIEYIPESTFNEQKWRTETTSRYKMRDDIINNQILKLKNKSEVVTLLGNPSNSTIDNQWVYDLGISSAGFGVQFHSLQITFKNNVVAKVKKFMITD
ncbi:hypothetical protein V6251_10085 [Olleya sp. Ti.3.14]|uniref:hypothetical protein n=1 Tax=Olleya sp. Ti.3.14 TaxID=3121297 RepID=UPI00311FD74C